MMNTLSIALLLAAPSFAADPFTIEANVVYGMYSGSALLLDVYQPVRPNGFGIVYVSGSGWTAPLAYSAPELKSNSQSQLYAKALASTTSKLTARARDFLPACSISMVASPSASMS